MTRLPALWSRRLQFQAGPQSNEFVACEEHRWKLETGTVSCFFASPKDLLQALDPDSDDRCDFCEEGWEEG